MRLKRVTACLLCVLLLLAAFPLQAAVAANEEEIDLMDNYVLAPIFDKREVTPFVSGEGKHGYGNAWINGLSMDLSSVSEEDLALSMRLYVENNTNNGDISILKTAPFGQIELASQMGGTYLIWQVRDLRAADGSALVAGWNDILLPFSTGTKQVGFDKDSISFFRMELANIATQPDSHTIRLTDVAVVDTSRPAQEVEESQWDTTYDVGTIPFSMVTTIVGRGSSTPTVSTSKVFVAIDASKHDPQKLQLLLDIELENLTNPGDVSVLSQISGQLELSSSGKCDQNELAVGIQTLNWQDGKNEYAINLSAFTSTNGDLDLSKINYMRIYMNGWPASFTDQIRIAVTNVRLVDTTNGAALPTLFSDGMMFQQNKPMNMWGYGNEGDVITAELYADDELLETQTATTAESGRWDLSFTAREGSYDAYTIKVMNGNDLIKTIQDVLVGEVWIAAGQSNMELTVATDMDSTEIIANADNPYLRMFLEPTYPLGSTGDQPIDPAQDIPGAIWGYGNNGTHVAKASAIGYTFIKNLQETLDVPVALINTAIGGSVIEGWLPREAVENDAAVKKALSERGLYYDAGFWPTTAGPMSTLYNQKIGPLEGMNIAGTIWYQGESNSNRSEIYDIEFDLLKRSWSEAFGFENGDMPLIFAQVAPHRYDNGTNNQQHLGYLAMYMERGWALSADKNTAMLPIYDLPLDHMRDGVSSDPIHPRIKTPVGERFFYSAMNMVYGWEEEYTAPVYASMELKDNAIYVTFDRVGNGLFTSDWTTEVYGFTIAGEDGVYVNAEAEIVDEDTVKVWNNRVSDPKNVIYAFDNYNQAANLCNSSGIPASPFRTVQLSDTTMKPDTSIDYFTAQDWMLADKDVWVFDSTNTTEWSAGYRPSFTVSSSASYTYDEFIFAEGLASLRVEHIGNVTVSPVLTYESIRQDWSAYKSLSVKVLNPNSDNKTLALKVATTDGKTYIVPTADGTDAATLISDADRFALITFDLTAIKDEGGSAANAAAVLSALRSLDLVITTTGTGTVFFDAFSVGMTDAVVSESELNEDEGSVMLTAEDLEFLLAILAEAESYYTPESLDAYYEAKAAAETLLANKSATPFQLTDAAAALVSAMEAAVELVVADYTALLEALDNAVEDLSPYTEKSAKAYTDVLTAATLLLLDENATQEEIDAATEALIDAQNALVLRTEMLGDVNGDGKVNTSDARYILQYAAEKIDETALNLSAADVNADDKVNTSDARYILQLAAEKIDKLPAED